MNGVRAQLLERVPEAKADAVSVNSLACRCDVAHYLVRQHLEALVSLGTLVKTEGAGVTHYYRNNEEADTMTEHDDRPLAERILEVLPHKQLVRYGRPLHEQLGGLTTLELGSKIQARPNSITAELKLLQSSGQVIREGEGKRGDPYRFYRRVLEDVTGPAYVCPDCGLDWPTGGPGYNHNCGPAMRDAGIHPDQDDVADEEELEDYSSGGTVRVRLEPAEEGLTPVLAKRPPQDPAPSVELPEGYTDAAEVLAAGIRAQEAEKAEKKAPGAPQAPDLEAPDTPGPPDREALEDRAREIVDSHAEVVETVVHRSDRPEPWAEPELPKGYTDAPEVVAARIEADAAAGDDHGDGVRLPRPTDDPEQLAGVPLSQNIDGGRRSRIREWTRVEATELEAEIQGHLEAGVPLEQLRIECRHDGTTVVHEETEIGPAIGFDVAAKNLRARAEEARRDLEILEAGAVLCERLRDEELDLAVERVEISTERQDLGP